MNNTCNFLLKNKVIFLVALFMFCFSNFSNSQSIKAIHSAGAIVPGQNITISIVFDDVSSTYSFDSWDMYLNWNTDVLEPVSATTVKAGLTGGSWTAPNYVDLPTHKVYFGFGNTLVYNNETVVNLTLKYHGGSTAISFYSDINAISGCYIYDFTTIFDLILPNNFYTGCNISGSLVPITSTGTGNWSDGTKWDLGHKPNTSNSNVIINSSEVTMDVDANITGNLTINSGGALTVNSGKTLAVTGDFLIKSDASATGSFINYGTYTAANTTVERYLSPWSSPSAPDGWHQISSPVASQAVSNFAAPGDATCDFFAWDESQALSPWIDGKPTSASSSFEVGKGYLVAYSSSTTLNHTFSGVLNNDVNYAKTVTNTTNSLLHSGYNLVGNPYPCGLSTSNFASWTSGLGNFFYVFNGVNNIAYQSSDDYLIPSMQAFWVKVSDIGSGSITIPSGARDHSAANVFKSAQVDMLKMFVTSPSNLADQVSINFQSNTTDGFDQEFDAPKFTSMVANAPQLYTMVGSHKLSINNMGNLTTASVPMGFEPKVNGTFTLKASNLNSFNAGTVITLQDLKTGTFQNLYQNDTYTFTANANDNVNRFVLHFNTAVGVDNNNQVASKIYSNGSEIYVSSTESIKQISIYNTVGQLIYTANNPQGLFTYNLKDNSTGYYIVKVITDKNVNSEKVFVK